MERTTTTYLDSVALRLALLLTLVGLGLRLIGLGQHSYWFDEAREVLRAQTPWPAIILLSEGADPPIFRLLVSPITAFTLDEFWLRLPSVLFGAAAIFLAYYWLTILGRPKLGIILAALLTVAPALIYYSQEVSQYSLTVMLALVLLIAHERAARFGRWNDWLLLAVSGLLAIYSYYGLAFLLPALGLDVAWRTWRNRNRQRMLGLALSYLTMIAGVIALYILILATQIERFSSRKATSIFSQQGLIAQVGSLDDLLRDGFLKFFTMPWSQDPPDIILLFMAALLAVGSVILWRFTSFGRRTLVILLSTMLLMYIAHIMGIYPFGGRYALMLVPLFLLPIAAAILWLWRWRWPAVVLLGLILLVFAFFWPNIPSMPNPWIKLPREELRPIIAQVQHQQQPGDFIYVYYGAKPAYQVYVPEQSTPTALGTWFRDLPAEDKINEIRNEVGNAPRFWLVLSHIHQNEDDELVEGLSRHYELVEVRRETNAAAALFQQNEVP